MTCPFIWEAERLPNCLHTTDLTLSRSRMRVLSLHWTLMCYVAMYWSLGQVVASSRGSLGSQRIRSLQNKPSLDADPTSVGAFEILPQLGNVVAVHLIQYPGTDTYLFMERPSGYHPDDSRGIAGTFNLRTREWKSVESPDGLFCAGHTLTADGHIVVVGGHQENAGWPSGLQSLRIFDNTGPTLTKMANMGYKRWYPTATLLPDKTVLIMGGTQAVGAGSAIVPDYEVWDLDSMLYRQFPVNGYYLEKVRQNYYPFNYVLPTGAVFNFCGRYGTILDASYGVYLQDLPRRRGYSNSQFPFTGTSVMLALLPEKNYKVEVVIFGGANENAAKDLGMKAGATAHRIEVIPPSHEVPVYTFGTTQGWDEENMEFPRVMGDATLLPNGMVVLLNGAQTGLAGDAANGGESRANNPTLFAELYDPDQPKNQRFTQMAQSQISRMYHSVAALTTDGTVMVAGCDRCNPFLLESAIPFSPPQNKAEYRIEIFYPPFWYDFDNKPRITASPTSAKYDSDFLLGYMGEVHNIATVTHAVLVAPSATTHSFNQNQRVVGLVIVEHDTMAQMLVLRAPPTPNHAPPQKYMLFLLNGKVYSKATWIHLEM